ncbi:MAG TPA: dTDP-4-dehydrorhamnose 3,5-epimerase [Balneolaceae bacterium]|nr:dTDP-4-dehydrorhamnose 3,5-epimerase [Balneolaceae bacterium]
MEFINTDIPDCFEIRNFHQADDRGEFIKVYNSMEYNEKAFDFMIEEMYFTVSRPGVFRGMHFQLPPHDHTKLVFCNYGSVQDFILDLRKDSPLFGKVAEITLSKELRNAVLIPRGCAHGFYVPDEESMLSYLVETGYEPDVDTGLLWNSIGHDFGFKDPIISERDKQLTDFNTFNSPF